MARCTMALLLACSAGGALAHAHDEVSKRVLHDVLASCVRVRWVDGARGAVLKRVMRLTQWAGEVMGPEDASGLCDSSRMERAMIAERAVMQLRESGDFDVIKVRGRGPG